jgi:hypothetical protein
LRVAWNACIAMVLGGQRVYSTHEQQMLLEIDCEISASDDGNIAKSPSEHMVGRRPHMPLLPTSKVSVAAVLRLGQKTPASRSNSKSTLYNVH